MTATNFRALAQELAATLQNLVINLEEAEEDAHPETGEPYSDVEHARQVLAMARPLLAHKPHEGPIFGRPSRPCWNGNALWAALRLRSGPTFGRWSGHGIRR